MTEQELQAIRDRWEKATPGPWFWDVNKACREILLESVAHRVVMGFKRYGMGGAQPTFLGALEIEPAEILSVPRKAHHPNFDMDIDHPDAQAIAHAPTDIADLLAEVKKLDWKRHQLYQKNAKLYLTFLRQKRKIKLAEKEIDRLNGLLDQRCANCHLKVEEVGK